MVRYYNTKRAPLAVPLRNGTTLYIRPKSWSEPVSAELEGSAALQRHRRKGDLVRGKEPVEERVPESEVKVVRVSVPKVEKPVAKPTPVVAKPVEAKPTVKTKKSKAATKPLDTKKASGKSKAGTTKE